MMKALTRHVLESYAIRHNIQPNIRANTLKQAQKIILTEFKGIGPYVWLYIMPDRIRFQYVASKRVKRSLTATEPSEAPSALSGN
jgi:hypothetical protein